MTILETTIEADPGDPPIRRPYRGVSNDQRRAERRARLIAAGIELFGTRGYHATTIKAVCRAAGLTERYFYESFAHSEDLLEAAYLEVSLDISDTAVEAAAQAGGDLSERALALVTSLFELLKTRPAATRLTIFEVTGVSPRIAAMHYANQRRNAGLIRAEMIRSLPSEPANGLSSDILAMSVLGSIYQLIKYWALEDFKTPVEVMVRHGQAVFVAVAQQWGSAETDERPGSDLTGR